MKKRPRLMASAKPNTHKVRVRKKTFVYSRIRKWEPSKTWHWINFMRNVAKVTLQKVKEICQPKNQQDGSDLHQ